MQTKTIGILALALSGLIIADTTQAQYRQLNGPVMLIPGGPQVYPRSLSCIVGVLPAGFPDDVIITNTGVPTILAGATLHWSIQNYQGNYTLTAPLAPNQTLYIANVVSAGVFAAGTPCNVTFV